MKITSNFDSGNINVIAATDPLNIQLEINKDHQSDFFQWFHFRLETMPFQNHKLHINNLENSAYPDGWVGYHAVASYDRQTWFRVPSNYSDGTLSFEIEPECGTVYFAYFAPYSYERHLDLITWAQSQEACQLETLGETLDGRDMSVLRVGGESDENKKIIWIQNLLSTMQKRP